MDDQADFKELISQTIHGKLMLHNKKEQELVDDLLASQKHLTSNLRTLINSLDTIVQLSTPRYNSSQGDLVHSLLSRAKTLAKKLEVIAARLCRIEEHLQATEGVHSGSQQADFKAATSSGPDLQQQQQQQQQQRQRQEESRQLQTQEQQPLQEQQQQQKDRLLQQGQQQLRQQDLEQQQRQQQEQAEGPSSQQGRNNTVNQQ